MRSPSKAMRFTLGLVLAVGVRPADASHNVPRRAKIVKAEFVRAFTTCLVPTATTSNGFPACTPVVEPHACSFGPTGRGQLKAVRSRGDVKLKAKVKGLESCESLTLGLGVDVHGALDDCGGSECTLAPFTLFPVALCVVSHGQCRIDTTVNTVNLDTLLPGKQTSIAIRRGELRLGDTRLFEVGLLVP